MDLAAASTDAPSVALGGIVFETLLERKGEQELEEKRPFAVYLTADPNYEPFGGEKKKRARSVPRVCSALRVPAPTSAETRFVRSVVRTFLH